MHELLLLRHAKAEAAELDGSDFQRPLSARGRDAALAAAQRLAALPWKPQRLLYSSAVRTASTAALVAKHFRLGAQALQEVPELYLATPHALRTALRTWHGDAKRVMIVGHNPGLSEWGGELDASHADDSLPTAGFWLIEFSGRQWQKLLDA
jgi:phosphohistidine phosphatase